MQRMQENKIAQVFINGQRTQLYSLANAIHDESAVITAAPAKRSNICAAGKGVTSGVLILKNLIPFALLLGKISTLSNVNGLTPNLDSYHLLSTVKKDEMNL